MKRIAGFWIVLTLIVSIFSMAASADAQEAFSADGSVIFEKEGLKVTTCGLDIDPTDSDVQPIIRIEIANGRETDAYFGVTNGSVNGFMSDVLLVNFKEEDGQIIGADYTDMLTLPAGSTGNYALSYYKLDVPGVNTEELRTMEFCFTEAEGEYIWPDYVSDPVVISVGEEQPVDLASLGTVGADNDQLTLVIGEQDYDDWFGPTVYVYAENKTDNWLNIAADIAEADGHLCDYIYYGTSVAPGKKCAGWMSFEGEISQLKGFENFTVNFSVSETENRDDHAEQEKTALEPISVQYPARVWGEYENEGIRLDIQPKYNDLITVEVPADDADGVLFKVSETASLEAGRYDGAGWLFSIGKVTEDRLHEMMCSDMSGAQVFAKDGEGSYYMYYHPTDVRFDRANPEEFDAGIAQWTMLCEWANSVPDRLADKNNLEYVSYNNSAVDIYVARAAYMEGVNATLSTTEYGPVDIAGVDGSKYAEMIMGGWFNYSDAKEAPDGEYVVLNFPDENTRVDFFFAPGAYARIVSGDRETLFQAAWVDDNMSYAEIMQEWYYSAAEHAGIREAKAG